MQIFREENGAWLVPVVTQAAEALRLLANRADEQLLSSRQEQRRKETAGSWLQKFYSTAKTVKGKPALPGLTADSDCLPNSALCKRVARSHPTLTHTPNPPVLTP